MESIRMQDSVCCATRAVSRLTRLAVEKYCLLQLRDAGFPSPGGFARRELTAV